MQQYKNDLILDMMEQFKINQDWYILKTVEEIKLGKHDKKIQDLCVKNVLSTSEASDLIVSLAKIERNRNAKV